MKKRIACLWWPAVAFAGLLLTPVVGRCDEKPETWSARDLSGRWAFNSEESDDANEKMREGMEKLGGRGTPRPPDDLPGGPAGGEPGEALEPIFEPAEELIIWGSDREVEVEEAYGRLRHLRPDGKSHKTDNGLATLKTRWKDGELVVETKRPRGGKVVESWRLTADRNRILIDVRVEMGFGPKLTLARVYDRVEEEGGVP